MAEIWKTEGILSIIIWMMNANEHYVSQVLLRRFAIDGHVQRYSVGDDKWKRLSPKKVFSGYGYNQLLISGHVDNTLEQAFSKVETPLPKTFETLERVAQQGAMELPSQVYDNLCWYCAFLTRICPFAKAAAPVDFVIQLDKELENGTAETLRDVLLFPEEIIQLFYRREHALGRKCIISSHNFLQAVYRIQFSRKYGLDYSRFRFNTEWTICNSPIDLPISDFPLAQVRADVHNAIFYGLPISPRLFLKGKMNLGPQKRVDTTLVKAATLNVEEAELWNENICLSALRELVSRQKLENISEIRSRAKAKGLAFHKIIDPERVISAGSQNFTSPFGLVVVSLDEYVKFIHSFIQPPDKS